MNIAQAKSMVSDYMRRLEYLHPVIRSDKFLDNSYSKIACREILKELEASRDLPFIMTPMDVFEAFSNKMKRMACDHPNKEHSFLFIQCAETAEFFIEQCWLDNWNWKKRRGGT